MRFTTPITISLVIWSILIQHFPPPPAAEEYGFLITRRKDNQPLFLGQKGNLTPDYDWTSPERWQKLILGERKVRDWKGYNDVILGIELNVIIPTYLSLILIFSGSVMVYLAKRKEKSS